MSLPSSYTTMMSESVQTEQEFDLNLCDVMLDSCPFAIWKYGH
uniref:Uncharacterized protein n=1 Tax=Arundo donax TaxID=35708 RepID=A0A0A9D9H6_ARUDO